MDMNETEASACMLPRLTGITGGIGAGKSVVSRMLRLAGKEVYDCDSEARRLMEQPGGEMRGRLSAICGDGIYGTDGTLDRSRMAGLLFSDAGVRERVNAVVHGAVRADIIRRRESLGERGCTEMWVESAIMATSGLASMCDVIWIVTAPDDVRLERAVARGGREEDILRRIEVQKAEEEAIARCGVPYVCIDNSGRVSLTEQLRILESTNTIKK